MNYEFDTGFSVEINLTASCDVNIQPTNDNTLTVDVSGDKPEDVTVTFDGKSLKVIETSSGAGNISINNVTMSGGRTVISGVSGNFTGTVISGGNIYMSGNSGSIYFNGKKIDLGNGGDDYTPRQITINIPTSITATLDAQISGVSKVTSQFNFEDAFVTSKGSGDISLIAANLDAQLAGSSDLNAQLLGGNLNLQVSGSTDVVVNGSMSQVTIQVSGSADIDTYGTCHGNYNASASGSADIRHHGTVLGRVRKSSSGCSTIQVN